MTRSARTCIVATVNTPLLFTYGIHPVRAAGEPSPCPTRGVPAWVALISIAAAGALGYVISGADSDKKAREAYAQGLARAPRPRLA